MQSEYAKKRLILRVLNGEKTERPPVWLMRQAGRCLPEYREVRKKHSFEEMLRDAKLGADVTMMPVDRFDMDAAILFTDLLVTLEAMGPKLSYKPGPEFEWTVDEPQDLEKLLPVDPEAHHEVSIPLETARLVRERLSPEKTLIGFVGAPFTLAAYLTEGKGSKTWAKLRRIAWQDPSFFQAIVDRLAQLSLDFGVAQYKAGCDCVQVFDSWAGVAEPKIFRRLLLPAMKKLIGGLQKEGIPVIYFVNGAGPHLDAMVDTGADCLGIDWRSDIQEVHERLPAGLPVQGNMDPLALYADEETLGKEVRHIVEVLGDRPHIFNTGHGLEPTTPLEGVHTLVRTLKEIAG